MFSRRTGLGPENRWSIARRLTRKATWRGREGVRLDREGRRLIFEWKQVPVALAADLALVFAEFFAGLDAFKFELSGLNRTGLKSIMCRLENRERHIESRLACCAAPFRLEGKSIFRRPDNETSWTRAPVFTWLILSRDFFYFFQRITGI